MPALGRNFLPEEDAPNGPAVCIISDELWQTRFGRRPLIGSTITLNGQPWEVVGTMPPRLSPPFSQVQVFAPRVFEVGGVTAQQVAAGAGYMQPIARLAAGASLAVAQDQLAASDRSYRARFATKLDADTATEARSYVEALVGPLAPTFNTLLGAVAFVLLIACANVAALFLGRLAARHKEIALRQSLGASRARVLRQLLVESLVFSTIAGATGVLLALWALEAIQSLVASQLPPNAVLTVSWRALSLSAAITVVTSLLVGLVPSIQASRADLSDALKDGVRGSSGARVGRFRAVLIVGEVALSMVLLVGSTLLLISFINLQRTAPGFDPHGSAAAFVGVPVARYATPERQAQFFADVVEQLRGRPGVTEAAAVVGLPMSGFNPRAPYSVAGRQILPLSQRPLANLAIVTPDYFRLMRIPFVAGRTFIESDRAGRSNVCVINESFARRLFPGETAIGKVLLRGRDAEIRAEVVGVIRDVKTNGLNVPAPDEIYCPMRQLPRPGMAIAVRTSGDPAALQSVIRSAVAAVDKDQPISFFSTLDTTVSQSLGAQRIAATLTSAFAMLALALAAIGMYSVLAHLVVQRTPEIGIRMALGAQPIQVIGLVMRGGLTLVAVGLLIGLPGAALTARLIRTLLFNIEALDPGVYVGVALMFAVVSAVACLVPSIRAARIDPLRAVRAD